MTEKITKLPNRSSLTNIANITKAKADEIFTLLVERDMPSVLHTLKALGVEFQDVVMNASPNLYSSPVKAIKGHMHQKQTVIESCFLGDNLGFPLDSQAIEHVIKNTKELESTDTLYIYLLGLARGVNQDALMSTSTIDYLIDKTDCQRIVRSKTDYDLFSRYPTDPLIFQYFFNILKSNSEIKKKDILTDEQVLKILKKSPLSILDYGEEEEEVVYLISSALSLSKYKKSLPKSFDYVLTNTDFSNFLRSDLVVDCLISGVDGQDLLDSIEQIHKIKWINGLKREMVEELDIATIKYLLEKKDWKITKTIDKWLSQRDDCLEIKKMIVARDINKEKAKINNSLDKHLNKITKNKSIKIVNKKLTAPFKI